ncbi:MAG: ATP-binding protein [Verrucomicrobiota bacterium]
MGASMALLKENALERLKTAWDAGRLAHAYLLDGPAGSGKEWLTARMAGVVLGVTGDEALTHPDYHSVAPESKSRRIVIEQMRTMEQAIQMKPMRGSTKVAVIHDADRLQPQAANAFLKTLEEPPPGCHIFLMTSLPDAIMETIISRCIAVPLRAACAAPQSEGERAVAAALVKALSQPGGGDIASGMRFTRAFQKATAAIREKVTGELEGELKQQLKHYRESADARWEESREDQIKAQAEAAVIRERENLIHATGKVLAAALRHHHLPSEPCAEPIIGLAKSQTPEQLLKRLAALDRTRDLLARNVQEGLALESGFLEMIATK